MKHKPAIPAASTLPYSAHRRPMVLSTYTSWTFAEHHSIAFRNPVPGNFGISLLHILATCGARLFSHPSVVRVYSMHNVLGLTIVHIVKGSAFASVLCFYPVIMSGIIHWQFNQSTIDIAPNGMSPVLKPHLLPWLH